MVSTTYTYAHMGIEAIEVLVQSHVCNGIPCFHVVGLPDKTVAESRERIRAAFFSAGVRFPQKRITVNLSPADLSKVGNHYDLPIAVSLLAEIGEIEARNLERTFFLGELGLDGHILPVCGLLPVLIKAEQTDMRVICPRKNFSKFNAYQKVAYLDTLKDLIAYLKNEFIPSVPETDDEEIQEESEKMIDIQNIKGQAIAKTAMKVAAAGKHNMLMTGPPGVGKSMIAKSFISILPNLENDEIQEVGVISSITNGRNQFMVSGKRPFRDPHHTLSVAAIIGGGATQIRPGEITLAHRGVLFLDELPEFRRDVLEALRQPLEEKYVRISRASGTVVYPCNFQLIAAMNPCRCGYAKKSKQKCKNADQCMRSYQSGISGPLMDRIDISITVDDVNPIHYNNIQTESSAAVRERIIAARAIQSGRYNKYKFNTNADADSNAVENIIFPAIETNAMNLLRIATDKHDISARSVYKIAKLSRTNADLDFSESINENHISEAIFYSSAVTQEAIHK